MTDLSLPKPEHLSEPPTEGGATAFRWPLPPYAAYALGRSALPLDCVIEGTGGRRIGGRLLSFDPQSGMAHMLIPPSRQPMPLAFEQIQQLTLSAPLRPEAPRAADDPEALLPQDPIADYRLVTEDGQERRGRTVGHVEASEGLYLFPPVDDAGGVGRVFVPRRRYREVSVGKRIGDILVEERKATAQQVEDALAEQQRLRSRRLGEALVAQRILTPDDLLAAIEHQARMPMVRIGEALVGLGLITQAQVDAALEQQKQDRSVPLGELLVRQGAVTRQDLQAALARKMGYPVVQLAGFPVEVEAIRAVPFAVAHRLNVLPLLRRNARIVVAMEDPTQRPAIEELEFVSQLKVKPVIATGSEIARALLPAYEKFGVEARRGESVAGTAVPVDFEPQDASQLLATLELQQANTDRDDDNPIEQSDNSLVRLVNTMIVDAWMQKVSDIHVETQPGRDKLRIRFRRDGVLRPYLELPHTYRSALVARLKIMCDLDIAERRKPQDGKINFARFSPQHKLELRVATIPTYNGLEDVVMRILGSAKPLPLDALGLSPANLRRLRDAIHRPHGMVLCVGPTGSGKTTTLHSLLGAINTPERKIWTAEDPIEITQAGLRQVQVNSKIDWTFAKALRAFLRADPDVIMVGEIRDRETAQVAVEASLTGHLVLSTLHTNSAPETITRLLDMGMDPFNFGDSLLAVVAQRLVRRLCPHCRTAHEATEAEVDDLLGDYLHAFHDEQRPSPDSVRAGWLERYAIGGRLQMHRAHGCDRCEHTGYDGRVGLHELMTVTRAVRRLIVTGGDVDQLHHQALVDGMCTLRQDGIEKVLQGLTTIGEVRATSNA